MDIDHSADEPKPKNATGRRVLYWVGGLFLVAAIVNTADRLIDPEGYERRQEQLAREKLIGGNGSAQKDAASQQQRDDSRSDGSHCLSAWDGSNRSLKEQIKSAARNPDSFEHIDTRFGSAVANEKTGRLEHPVVMRFRSQNGFGGMNVGVAVASVDNEKCDATVINVSER